MSPVKNNQFVTTRLRGSEKEEEEEEGGSLWGGGAVRSIIKAVTDSGS